MDFAAQAEAIRALTEKYTVDYIGIDATGIGAGGLPARALILPGGARHPLHAGNENRNGAESERHHPTRVSGV